MAAETQVVSEPPELLIFQGKPEIVFSQVFNFGKLSKSFPKPWTAKPNTSVGGPKWAAGFQSMTFDYLLRNKWKGREWGSGAPLPCFAGDSLGGWESPDLLTLQKSEVQPWHEHQ